MSVTVTRPLLTLIDLKGNLTQFGMEKIYVIVQLPGNQINLNSINGALYP